VNKNALSLGLRRLPSGHLLYAITRLLEQRRDAPRSDEMQRTHDDEGAIDLGEYLLDAVGHAQVALKDGRFVELREGRVLAGDLGEEAV
jgi:hypothetical protein